MLFSPEQFESCLDEILFLVMKERSISKKVMEWFKFDDHEKDIDRLVIVLDNVDRCEKKIAYELLADFKNFLGKTKVVFIIPVDDSALRSHVASINGGGSNEADEFLRKIFNVTIKLKPFKTHDLYNFTEALSTKHELKLKPDTIDVIAKEYATNPRRIIQFLNNLISEKDYLSRRVNDRFVSEHETLIALVLLIREEWPSLYNKLSNAPYKLKNLRQSLELTEENVEQKVFIRKTYPHTSNIEERVLSTVFTNQDQHQQVSEALIDALSEHDSKVIVEFNSSQANGNKYLAGYLIDELNQAISRGVITGLANTFNKLTFLNSITSLSESMNKRIFGELSQEQNVIQCLENYDNPKNMAKYIADLESQSILGLSDVLLGHLDELVRLGSSSESKIPPIWTELVKELAICCTGKRILSGLGAMFLISFRNHKFNLMDLQIPKENFQHLVNDQFLDLIINRYDFDDETCHEQLLYLIKVGVITSESIELFIGNFIENSKGYVNVSKDDFISQLKSIIEIFDAGNFKFKKNEALVTLVESIFLVRSRQVPSLPRANISLFQEILPIDEDSELLTNFIFTAYAVSPGNKSISKRIIEIANLSKASENYVLEKIKWLHEEFGFKLAPLHEFLQSRTDENANLLAVFDWLLIQKNDNQEYTLAENYAANIVNNYFNILVAQGGAEKQDLEIHFEVWVKDNRIKKILTSIVSSLDKETISSLPKSVQATAYSYISEGDNIFEYENDIELLAAMNESGQKRFNAKIEKVIIDKLLKEETFMDGVELLENLNSFNGMNITSIKTQLKDKDTNEEDAERVEKCLKKLS